MSNAMVSGATPKPRKKPQNVARKRWIFRISLILALLPLFYVVGYFDRIEMNRGAKGLGERIVGEYAVGPWSVRLAEWNLLPPVLDGQAGYMKTFSMALCAECTEQVKAAYIRVGKPRSLRAAGGIFFGSPYRQLAGLHVPERTAPDAEVWITLEGWDGSMHQIALPIAEASPTTAEWLSKRGNPT